MRKYATASLLMAALLALASLPAGATDDGCGGHRRGAVVGGTPCCDRCGCACDCLQKVCLVVCEIKKETKTCWCVECQEIGLLMPGHRGCCDQCQPPPRCGRTKCVKKLVKKEYQVDVPVYKCVVRYLCPACLGNESAGGPAVAPKLPAAPAPSPAPSAVPTPPSKPLK